MMSCAQCFDNHMTAERLADVCYVASVSHEGARIRLIFKCPHNRTHVHVSYPLSADWPFALAQLSATRSATAPAAA